MVSFGRDNVIASDTSPRELNLPGRDEYLLAQSTRVTTTIKLKSSSLDTQVQYLEHLAKEGITYTLKDNKLAINVNESQARSALNKLYGFGSYDDAFRLHCNLNRLGLLLDYSYGSLAKPTAERELSSGGKFSIVRVEREPEYAFPSGRRESAVRYSINAKGTTFHVIMPDALYDHTGVLSDLSNLIDRTSPKALKEFKAIRVDVGKGPKIADNELMKGSDEHNARVAANARTGVVSFFDGNAKSLEDKVYFHALGHFVADEFRARNKSSSNSGSVDPGDVWEGAMKDDPYKIINHGPSQPRVEDFPNAVEKWVLDRDSFRIEMLNRFKLLDKFSDYIVDPKFKGL
jgi:hypothetical protein